MSGTSTSAPGTTRLERGACRLIERFAPELVIASGDLTHRGRREEHERAAAIPPAARPAGARRPGNHDIPYTFPARFTSPWREFERLVGDDRAGRKRRRARRRPELGPAVAPPVRRPRRRALDARPTGLGGAAAGALRVVVAPPPADRRAVAVAQAARRAAQPRALAARRLRRGADRRRAHPPGGRRGAHEFEVLHWRRARRRRLDHPGPRAAAAAAAGRGSRLRGLPPPTCGRCSVETYIWRDGDWGLTALRTFARGREPLVVDPLRRFSASDSPSGVPYAAGQDDRDHDADHEGPGSRWTIRPPTISETTPSTIVTTQARIGSGPGWEEPSECTDDEPRR